MDNKVKVPKSVDSDSYKHKWKCLSVGLYDSLYECEKCNKQFMERVDAPDGDLPTHGCKEE